MDEILVFLLGGLLRLILFISVELFFYQIFYYIGAVPVWILSGGRLPTKDPTDLPKEDKKWYAIIGIATTLVLLGLFLLVL